MELRPSDEQEGLVAVVEAFLAKACPTTCVRNAEPVGFDHQLWNTFAPLGGPAMGVSESLGGGGSSLLDLELICEQLGAVLAPLPFVESAVTARTLAAAGDEGAGLLAPLLADLPSPAAVALRPAVDGLVHHVPAGGVSEIVVGLDGDRLVGVAGAPFRPVVPTRLGGIPLATWDLRAPGRLVLARGDDAMAVARRAADEWRVLTAASLVGLAARALDIGVAYAGERHQFGVPIGSFQSLARDLADAATAVDGARLLAREAAWAADEGRAEAPVLAAMAFGFAARTAQRSAATSLHVHGGYGFMLEYDIQLYYRRAKAWALAAGDPRAELAGLAAGLFDEPSPATLSPATPAPRTAAETASSGMDFRLGPESEQFRSEVRAFVAEHLSDEAVERVHRTGTAHDWDFYRALGAKGWIAASWPAAYGGQDRSPFEMTALRDELRLASAPMDGMANSLIVARTLRHLGTEAQQQRFLPPLLAGEMIFALGYSEPESGSDVAAARTRARRDGDEWVIDGQKMFTTLAHEASHVFLLARTDPEVAKHKGLTMFIVPLDAPGIEIQAVHTMGGERTNITFYSEVRVPDELRVGEVDRGWDVMTVALTFERGGFGLSESDRVWAQAVAWARRALRPDGTAVIADPLVRERLAVMRTNNEVAKLLAHRVSWLVASGGLPGVEGSMHKLFYAESLTADASELLDMLGAEGLVPHGEAGAPVDGWVEHLFRHAAVTTIYGGTSEIQRSIIAERGLGLPRTRR